LGFFLSIISTDIDTNEKEVKAIIAKEANDPINDV